MYEHIPAGHASENHGSPVTLVPARHWEGTLPWLTSPHDDTVAVELAWPRTTCRVSVRLAGGQLGTSSSHHRSCGRRSGRLTSFTTLLPRNTWGGCAERLASILITCRSMGWRELRKLWLGSGLASIRRRSTVSKEAQCRKILTHFLIGRECCVFRRICCGLTCLAADVRKRPVGMNCSNRVRVTQIRRSSA
jgi:hypothetical protein